MSKRSRNRKLRKDIAVIESSSFLLSRATPLTFYISICMCC